MPPFAALTLYHTDPAGRVVVHAMPVMVGVLVVLALAYRYYSAFLAAKVAALDDRRVTPAHEFNDGQNYHPTNKWVLFGHHFAAISGAGPLIGPVLAIQYGFAPGLVWLVIGVCLAGAVQDMLVMAASVRRDGKSIAEIARAELGVPAAIIASVAILFIVVIALAGLGFVIVKALGGEEVKLPAGMTITLPDGAELPQPQPKTNDRDFYTFPAGCSVRYSERGTTNTRSEMFTVSAPVGSRLFVQTDIQRGLEEARRLTERGGGTTVIPAARTATLPAGCTQVVPGSSWGTFTIACTIPIDRKSTRL